MDPSSENNSPMVSPNDDKIVKITVSSVMQGVKQVCIREIWVKRISSFYRLWWKWKIKKQLAFSKIELNKKPRFWPIDRFCFSKEWSSRIITKQWLIVELILMQKSRWMLKWAQELLRKWTQKRTQKMLIIMSEFQQSYYNWHFTHDATNFPN